MRTQEGLFVVEGAKMVDEAVQSDMKVVRVLSTADYTGAEHISPKDMERISRLKTPSSVLAVVEIPHNTFSRQIFANELVLALDDIQDPGNVGTILRTAAWFGIRNVICSPATADCFNQKTIQATMGAIFHVAVHYGELDDMLKDIQPVYGTFLDGENIYSSTLSPTGVIVMGNEGQGISDNVARVVSERLYIPSCNNVGAESLNVASATAIVLAEFRRRN